MNILSGFNTQEIRRLQPYLSALLRRIKELETGKVVIDIGGGGGGGGGTNIVWGADGDIQPTGDRNSAGTLNKVARADHQHLFKFPTTVPASTPDGSAYFDPSASAIRVYVGNVPTTRVVAGGDAGDVRPTGTASTGTAPRYSFADHSHPTALLPQSNTQTPALDEIRYNADNKIVRWNGSAWVPLSVETFEIEWGTNSDVQATGLRSAGTSARVARADHSHPTAILHRNDISSPVINEIAYNADNKLVRWDGEEWVELSVERLEAGTNSDVVPTRFRSAGSSARYARADHSHPTAILPQADTQTPVYDEIRYTTTNQLVRWNGTAWANIISALPVPADPLVLPYDNQVSSPQDRQLVNRSAWDNIGNATVFYRDVNFNQYRLIFARPLVISTTSTPSGKDVWTNTADELVLKEGTGYYKGAVLWRRKGNTTDWSPVGTQLSDDLSGISFPSDVGVLTRSSLTGTSGSRRWFIRGAQEGGSFRAPFAGIATFTSATAPAPTNLSTTLEDGYGYFVHDIDRVDIVKPTTNGNKHPLMLPHYIIAPVCRTFITTTDPSGHYVRDELWNSIWVVAFRTTTSATTNLVAILPTITVPIGTQAGRVLLYLHNPQSSTISTIFALLVRTPTSTGISDALTSDATVSIPANTTVVADLGHLTFPASTSLSHHRSFPITPIIVRRRANETANSNAVFCLAVVIVPQREA